MKRETAETYGLAAIGAMSGIYKYYIRPELTAKRGWLALGAFVLAYDILSPKGETLSEGVDRALDKHRILTLGAIAATAGHLANVIPQQLDPIHQGVELLKRL